MKPLPRRINDVRVGLFKIRLVRNGPWVAAAIQRDDAAGWFAVIDGQHQGAPNHDPHLAPEVERIWMFGRDVEAKEYRAMTRPGRDVNPRQKIDLANTRSIF